MMKLTLASLMIAEVLLLGRGARASEPLDLYHDEQRAIAHCGSDPVVWLDVASNRYSLKGQPGYGTDGQGGYTCKRDAVRSGNHASTRRASG